MESLVAAIVIAFVGGIAWRWWLAQHPANKIVRWVAGVARANPDASMFQILAHRFESHPPTAVALQHFGQLSEADMPDVFALCYALIHMEIILNPPVLIPLSEAAGMAPEAYWPHLLLRAQDALRALGFEPLQRLSLADFPKIGPPGAGLRGED